MHKTLENGSIDTTLAVAVFRIFKALAKVTLRYGMAVGAFNELARRAYLEASVELIEQEDSTLTTSRICAMTGLYRKEVRRLEELPPLFDSIVDDKYNRSSRVITGWRRDPDFHTRSGKPAALRLEGANGFDELVRRYSGDMSPVAMRQELERLGIISISSRDTVTLQKSAYLSDSSIDGLQILGADTTELIETIDNNLRTSDTSYKQFQRKVSYHGIPHHRVDAFREYAREESQQLLERLDQWLDKADQDESISNGKTTQVSVGVYHRCKDNPPTVETDRE